MEYSDRMDAQIAGLLSSRNRVTPAHLPGIPDEEGAALLEHYAEIHGVEQGVVWDGARLARRKTELTDSVESDGPGQDESDLRGSATSSITAPSEPSRRPSPVDEILAAPVGESLLDSKGPSGAVSAWLWLLPLVFLLPGGVLGWWLARETNRGVARALLAVGVIMTLITIAIIPALQGMSMQLRAVL